jgi:epoxyqueuosine reductase
LNTIQKSTDPESLPLLIKSEARRLGFQLVGITSPDPPVHLDVYARWLQAGRHGEMGYMATQRAKERRADPRKVLSDCKSILVVAANCLPSQKPSAPDVKIAAYAQGDDYHLVLTARLEKLIDFIQVQLDEPCSYKIYVDTGPLLERELAQRAGLGWIGKNTCLIHPKIGSHFLLGEVLLGIALPFDEPFQSDHCGSCTRCIDQCPTHCILPDRTIDSRRCISYLTIEHRGEVPRQLRAKMGDWVFGCDICQDVCPWNHRFAAPTDDASFEPRSFLEDPSLEDFLRISPDDYRTELRDSPLKRSKRVGLVRNATIAAGNRKREQMIPLLGELLFNEGNPLVLSHAVWALQQIGGKKAKGVLGRALHILQDLTILEEIRRALESW